jgi:RNA polymerase sigma-70 factor (ECF subfamily)
LQLALRAEEIEDPGIVDLDRDRALVLRYQRGDEHAFDELYRRYYPRLHQYCQRRVGDTHVSEELAQEAFLRALKAMPRFAGERRFYPWMTVIAQRLCIDHHRRAARVEPSPDIDLGVVEADHDAVFAEVDRSHLGEAMARLAPRHREVLALREQRGWSYQQIASHFDVPVTTVEALLHRARKALKREFLAVSGGGRLASIPFLGWLVARVGRMRTRFDTASASHLIPFAGTAAAGVAAVSLVFNPFAPSAPAPQLVTTPATAAPASASPGTVAVTPVPLAATSTPSTDERQRATTSAAAPPPVANAGVAQIYMGPESADHIREQNDTQPVQVEVPALIDAGVNPSQLVTDITDNIVGGKKK